jgi:hypothetical protein
VTVKSNNLVLQFGDGEQNDTGIKMLSRNVSRACDPCAKGLRRCRTGKVLPRWLPSRISYYNMRGSYISMMPELPVLLYTCTITYYLHEQQQYNTIFRVGKHKYARTRTCIHTVHVNTNTHAHIYMQISQYYTVLIRCIIRTVLCFS